MTEAEIRAIVNRDGGRIPCSRYAMEDGSDLAEWVIALEAAMTNATGEESTPESVEQSISLIVNSHDDVEYVLSQHGSLSLPGR